MAELDVTIHTDAIKRATTELAKMVGSFEKADKAVDKLESRSLKANAALDRINTSVNKVDVSLRGANGQFIKVADNFNKNADAIHKLRMRYDEVYASQVRYAKELNDLNAALSQGAITPAVYGQNLLKLDQAFNRVGSGSATAGVNAEKFGKQMHGAGMHSANVFAQLNDIGVMLAAGQNPIQLALQQGTQLNQVWGQMGGNVKMVGKTIASAFMSMLSPINLVTIGVIAGAGALTQWALSGRETKSRADQVKDSLDKLRTSYSTLADMQDRSRMGIREQINLYGQYWLSVRRVTDALVANAAEEARQAADASLSKLGLDASAFQAYQNQITAFMQARNDMSEQSRQIAIEAQGFNEEALQQYGLQYDELVRLNQVQNELKNNDLGLNERNRLSAEFNSLVIKGVANGAALKTEMLDSAKAVLNLSDQMTRAAAKTEDAERAMAAFSATANSASLQHLVSQAAQLANNLISASQAASNIGTGAKASVGGFLSAVTGAWEQANKKLQEIESGGLGNRPGSRPFSVSETAMYGPESRGGGKGGGGAASRAAAEVKAAEKSFQTVRELIEKESMFQFAEYEKRQTQLDAALNKQLISQQRYETMKQQLRTLYFGSEFEKNALQYQLDLEQLDQHHASKLLSEEEYLRARKELQWKNLLSEENRSDMASDLSNTATYFGQLHSLTGSSYDGLLKLQQSFQAAAALMNAWKGYTDALAKGGLSPWAKLAWGGKILAAGLGAVNAIKGGGKGGGKSASTAAPPSSAGGAGSIERSVNLTLIGEGPFSKDSIVRAVEEINKAIGDGSKVNVRARNG